MDRPTVSRRSYGIGLATVSALSLAGCTNGGSGDDGSGGDDGGNDSNGDSDDSNDGGNGSETDFDYLDREEHTLAIHFENENGERVTPRTMEGKLAPVGFTAASINFGPTSVDYDILEVECQEGTWRLTVESTEDEFESVEEEIVLDSDTEITVTLDGAVPFSERNTEGGGE